MTLGIVRGILAGGAGMAKAARRRRAAGIGCPDGVTGVEEEEGLGRRRGSSEGHSLLSGGGGRRLG